MGKQTLSAIADVLGLRRADVLETAVVKAWTREDAPIEAPLEVQRLRQYVAAL